MDWRTAGRADVEIVGRALECDVVVVGAQIQGFGAIGAFQSDAVTRNVQTILRGRLVDSDITAGEDAEFLSQYALRGVRVVGDDRGDGEAIVGLDVRADERIQGALSGTRVLVSQALDR